MALFGQAKREFLGIFLNGTFLNGTFLKLRNGIPSYDTFSRVFRLQELLSLQGRVVTADAMHCQRQVAQQLVVFSRFGPG